MNNKGQVGFVIGYTVFVFTVMFLFTLKGAPGQQMIAASIREEAPNATPTGEGSYINLKSDCRHVYSPYGYDYCLYNMTDPKSINMNFQDWMTDEGGEADIPVWLQTGGAYDFDKSAISGCYSGALFADASVSCIQVSEDCTKKIKTGRNEKNILNNCAKPKGYVLNVSKRGNKTVRKVEVTLFKVPFWPFQTFTSQKVVVKVEKNTSVREATSPIKPNIPTCNPKGIPGVGGCIVKMVPYFFRIMAILPMGGVLGMVLFIPLIVGFAYVIIKVLWVG